MKRASPEFFPSNSASIRPAPYFPSNLPPRELAIYTKQLPGNCSQNKRTQINFYWQQILQQIEKKNYLNAILLCNEGYRRASLRSDFFNHEKLAKEIASRYVANDSLCHIEFSRLEALLIEILYLEKNFDKIYELILSGNELAHIYCSYDAHLIQFCADRIAHIANDKLTLTDKIINFYRSLSDDFNAHINEAINFALEPTDTKLRFLLSIFILTLILQNKREDDKYCQDFIVKFAEELYNNSEVCRFGLRFVSHPKISGILADLNTKANAKTVIKDEEVANIPVSRKLSSYLCIGFLRGDIYASKYSPYQSSYNYYYRCIEVFHENKQKLLDNDPLNKTLINSVSEIKRSLKELAIVRDYQTETTTQLLNHIYKLSVDLTHSERVMEEEEEGEDHINESGSSSERSSDSEELDEGNSDLIRSPRLG